MLVFLFFVLLCFCLFAGSLFQKTESSRTKTKTIRKTRREFQGAGRLRTQARDGGQTIAGGRAEPGMARQSQAGLDEVGQGWAERGRASTSKLGEMGLGGAVQSQAELGEPSLGRPGQSSAMRGV